MPYSINNDCIYDLATALIKDCKEFRSPLIKDNKGIGLVAQLSGIRASTLYKKLDTSQDTHCVHIEDLEKVLAVTRGHNTLNAIGRITGAVWLFPDELPAFAGDMDLWKASNNIMEKNMALINEFQEALEDGELDSEEESRIEKRLQDMQQAAYQMLSLVQQFRRDEELAA
ncbi:phage regulatory CII family protein [Neptunomonas phycophila]|uniref:phage regulatory CII family protein n=1 Tax=Neptunomonas phycophila TaxID=1572645 RepID=UPI0037363FEC